MTRTTGTICLALLLIISTAVFAACGIRRAPDVTPTAQTLFTSTRQVTSLTATPDGALWVGTTGGVLRRSAGGQWRKWTRLSGLPSDEITGLELRGGVAVAHSPSASVAWQNGQWQTVSDTAKTTAPTRLPGETCRTTWHGQTVIATLDGLQFGTGGACRSVPLPPQSPGTHISALLPHGAQLWAALYGDGLWAWGGGQWQALSIGLPTEAREITALAQDKSRTVWAGTRRGGVYACDGKTWRQCLMPNEPFSHNAEAIASYHGSLYVSTLEDGLAVKTPQGWQHVATPTLSSNAPRQMVVFKDKLYVRHGNGLVDRLDGTHWARSVFPFLPRRQVSALATDGSRLYLAQWGGWSEWDGAQWTHRLTLPDLQGLPITTLLPAGNTLWVGTQGRGLAEVTRATQTVRWHDERDGLPDDWVTCLTQANGRVWAGTFVGGLAFWDGSHWTTYPELGGQNVTALEPNERDGLAVATRRGVSQISRDGKIQPLAPRFPFLDPEAQTLCAVPGGLWIGERTGLFFVPLKETRTLADSLLGE